MSEQNYRPSGDLQGDTKAMPERGSATGVDDSYGASLDGEATNGLGGISGSTKSDGMQEGGYSKNKR
jgi:hypothetical protein